MAFTFDMKQILNLLKIAISLYIVYFLFQNYKLNIVDIINFNYLIFVPIIIIGFVIVLINTYRLKILLYAQGIHFFYFKCLKINMISSLFDVVLPSSNGGDLIKVGYILKNKNISKMAGTFTTLYDRLIGFFSIFIFLLIASIFTNLNYLTEINIIKFIVFFIVIFASFALWISGSRRLFNLLSNFPLLHKVRLISMMNSIKKLRNNIKILVLSLLLSLSSQALNFFNIFLIIYFFNINDINIINFIMSCSIGLIGNIFGFAGGFGAGTFAFDYSFNNYLSIDNSLQIVLIYQFSQILIRLLGLPIFIFDHNAN